MSHDEEKSISPMETDNTNTDINADALLDDLDFDSIYGAASTSGSTDTVASTDNPWANTDDTTSSLPQQTFESQLANLDTIEFRLATSSDASFVAAIQRVLPMILPTLNSSSTDVRNKTVSIITSAIKRLRTISTYTLPLTALTALFHDSKATDTPFFTNFTAVLIERAFATPKTVDAQVRWTCAWKLIEGIHKRTSTQQRTLLHLLLQTLNVVDSVNADALNVPTTALAVDADRSIVLAFLRDVMLFTNVSQTQPKAAALNTAGAPGLPAATTTTSAVSVPTPTVYPEGLSADAVALVTNDSKLSLSIEQWNALKLDILHWLELCRSAVSDADAVLLITIAQTIGNDNVTRLADALNKQRLTSLDINDAHLISSMYSLCLGGDNKIPINSRRSPVGQLLRIRYFTYFNRSKYAVSMEQTSSAIRLIFATIFDPIIIHKLKMIALNFLLYFIKNNPINSLNNLSTLILNTLLKLLTSLPINNNNINNNNNKTFSDVNNTQTRGQIYILIGYLSYRLSGKLSVNNLKLMSLLFKALQDEIDDSVLVNIHESIHLIRLSSFQNINNNNNNNNNNEMSQQLQQMLLSLISVSSSSTSSTTERRIQLNSLQCINRLYPFDDVTARYMCLICSDAVSAEVRDEAKRGLQPYNLVAIQTHEKRGRIRADEEAQKQKDKLEKHQQLLEEGKQTETTSNDTDIADGAAKVEPVTEESENDVDAIKWPSFTDLMVCISTRLQLQPNDTSKSIPLPPRIYSHILDFAWECFTHNAKAANQTAAEFAMSNAASSSFMQSLMIYQQIVEIALSEALSEVSANASQHLVDLVSVNPSQFASLYALRLDWIKKYLLGNVVVARHSMALLIEAIVEQLPHATIEQLLQELVNILNGLTVATSIGAGADAEHGAILGSGVLAAAMTKRMKTADTSETSKELLTDTVNALVERLDSNIALKDPALSSAAAVSIGRIAREGPLPLPLLQATQPNVTVAAETKRSKMSASYDRHSVVKRLLLLTRGGERKAERLSEESIKAIGLIIHGDSHSTSLVRLAIAGLLALVSVKHEEIHFSVGEALAEIGQTVNEPVPQSDDNTTTTSYPSAMQEILSFSVEKLSKGSQIERAAACTWILCLIKYAGTHPTIQAALHVLQQTLSVALTDSNQFTQECAAKAMSQLYEISPPAIKEKLVASLMSTFSVGQRRVTADTEIVVDEERGETSTYRELLSVANEMGQPDLAYKFADLAAHHSVWQSKVGAAFTLGNILKQNNSHLTSQLDRLIPKLYRYQYDPNIKVQSSMKAMWIALIDHPQQIITLHFDNIIKDLLKAQTSRQYRARLSSTSALNDLIISRSFEQLNIYFYDLWNNIFRCIDDINENVRKSAIIFSNTLGNITVRLCDIRYTNKTIISQVLNIIIPILTLNIHSRAKEVQSISLKVLLNIIKIANNTLRPHLADLISILLESMSTLEPAQYNYIQQHVQSLDMTEEQIELARLSMSRNSPLSDAVSSCMNLVDEESLPPLILRLTEIIRAGLGLTTLTATAKFITSLATSPIGPFMRDHISGLLTALVIGLNDPSVSIRRVYAQTIGYLCRVAKRPRVGKMMRQMMNQYVEPTSTITQRQTAALTLHRIVVNGGDNAREYYNDVIATAFLGERDNDAETAKTWTTLLEEVGSSSASAALSYHSEIVALLMPLFNSPAFNVRETAFKAMTQVVDLAGKAFAEHVGTVLPAICAALPGRIYAGKEQIMPLIVSISRQCTAAVDSQSDLRDATIAAVIEECRRPRNEYRRAAIRAAGELADIFTSVDMLTPLRPILEPILQQSMQQDAPQSLSLSAPVTMSDEDIDQRKKQMKADALLYQTAYETLGQAYPTEKHSATQISDTRWTIQTFVRAFASGLDWNVRMSVLRGLKAVLSKVSLTASAGSTPILSSDLFFECIELICGLSGIGDMKHSVVRVSGIETLNAFFSRDSAQLDSYFADKSNATAIGRLLVTVNYAANDSEGNVVHAASRLKTSINKLQLN